MSGGRERGEVPGGDGGVAPPAPGERGATYSFRCSACGGCCDSPPALSLPELFRHQDVFVGCLAIRRLPPRAGAAEGDARFTLAPAALEHPSTSRCPALGADGRCTLHGDGKPATCAAVPLDPLAPDHRQHEVLAERLRGRAGEGACLVRGEREGFVVLADRDGVRAPAFREALARRRAAMAADARQFGDRVFELLRAELSAPGGPAARLPPGGVLTVSLVPALVVLAGSSEADRARCVRYLDAQLALLERRVDDALARRRREERAATEQLRAWSKSYRTLAAALRAEEPVGRSSRGGDGAPGAEPDLAADAARLRIAPDALRTVLAAAEGRCEPGVRRTLHATVKPGGATCNLACTYCYYLDKPELLGRRPRRMDDALLETFVADYIRSQDGEEIAFTWHGGEPTLLGLAFFEKVVALQANHAPPGRRISNDIQTNGTLLDDRWCAFLAEHGFLVGLSVDGPRHLHDLFRRSRDGSSSGEAALAAARRLRRHGVPFATLTTVNRVNATRPVEVYRFLRDELGSTSMQLIPCVEPNRFAEVAPGHHPLDALPVLGSPGARPGDRGSAVTSWSVDPEDWGYFLCAVLDEWAAHDVGRVKVNLIETLVAQRNGRPALQCASSPFCGKNVAVEHDGRVYSCDHFVYPEHEIGRVGERSLAEIVLSPRQLEFGLAKRNALSPRCRECAHLALCWGDCPRTRFVRTRDGATVSYLCAGWRRFFEHGLPVVERLGLARPEV